MSPVRRRSRLPYILMSVGVILVVVAAGALILSRPSSPDLQQPLTQASIPFPEIPRVSLVDAKAALDSGSAVFLDVRDARSYSQGHIPGALSILEMELPVRMDELDPDDWIIPY